ncbi:type VII secretion target, partial [Mycobacterium marinum]|uniref:type VII secretion target n=1 Tax=Mycobacterium marinum TaxID=1781 RepID=UPI001FB6D1FA
WADQRNRHTPARQIKIKQSTIHATRSIGGLKLSAYEAVRASAGRALEGVADGLSTNLTRALASYADTDQRGAEILDAQIDN